MNMDNLLFTSIRIVETQFFLDILLDILYHHNPTPQDPAHDE